MKFKAALKKYLTLFRYKFPSKLPTENLDAFNAWVDKLFRVYELPNLPSYKHAIAAAVMHLPPTTSHVPNAFFAKTIRKAMASQLAYEVLMKIREDDKKKALEEEDKASDKKLTLITPSGTE